MRGFKDQSSGVKILSMVEILVDPVGVFGRASRSGNQQGHQAQGESINRNEVFFFYMPHESAIRVEGLHAIGKRSPAQPIFRLWVCLVRAPPGLEER